jgi:hypothetical protein
MEVVCWGRRCVCAWVGNNQCLGRKRREDKEMGMQRACLLAFAGYQPKRREKDEERERKRGRETADTTLPYCEAFPFVVFLLLLFFPCPPHCLSRPGIRLMAFFLHIIIPHPLSAQ